MGGGLSSKLVVQPELLQRCHRQRRHRIVRVTRYAAVVPDTYISREDYWERNQPKYEKTDWASTTVQLPVVAPHSE
jgi:hypothetical protein